MKNKFNRTHNFSSIPLFFVELKFLLDGTILPSGTVGGGYAGMDCQIFLKGSVPIMIGIVLTKSNPIPEGSTLNLSLKLFIN